MFNGKVNSKGEITKVASISKVITQVEIKAKDLDYNSLKIGDIMLHNGCSLTISKVNDNSHEVLVYLETLSCTTGFDQVGNIINIERPLKLGEYISGNLVSGFIDDIATVTNINPNSECNIITFELNSDLGKYLVNKSAIVINGVSLTINNVKLNTFQVNLGPRTLAATNLNMLKVGSKVNIEMDKIAKYVYQFTKDILSKR